MGKEKENNKTAEETPEVKPTLDEIKAAAAAEVAQLKTDADTQRAKSQEAATAALSKTQEDERDAYDAYNRAMWQNLGQITSEIETKQNTAKEKDAVALKREKAMRYISGLGDTLSSIANLVGTAHGAANQNQTYHSNTVVQKAEEARKARKIEIDALNDRLNEMLARQRELRAAGNLKEAEVAARQAKEQAALQAQHAAANTESDRYYFNLGRLAEKDAVDNYNKGVEMDFKEKQFVEGQRQFDERMEQEKKNRAAANYRAKLAADAAGERNEQQFNKTVNNLSTDADFQKKVLPSALKGVRDELAASMGYKDYNEYLQYKNVSGFGEDIPGQRNKESKRIREEREAANPETVQLLNMLANPSTLSDDNLTTLMGMSTVFADAVEAGAKKALGGGSSDSGDKPEGSSKSNKYDKYARK